MFCFEFAGYAAGGVSGPFGDFRKCKIIFLSWVEDDL